MHMERGCRWMLTLAFGAMMGAMGLVQAAHDIRLGESTQVLDLFRQAPTVANLRSYEKDMESRSLIAQAVRPWTQYARFRLLADPGEAAVFGRAGWWFYKQDVRYLVEPCDGRTSDKTGRAAAVSAIAAFRDRLAARGIRLVVIPVPGKPSVYPDMLTRRARPADPSVSAHNRAILADLSNAGVETIDLLSAFAAIRRLDPDPSADPCYLVCDTHWTARAARAAAEAVAQRILDLGWARPGAVDYGLKPVVVNRSGDIVRMLRSPPVERLFEPEEVQCEQVIQPGTGRPYRDDPGASILVLGDSFLRIYERDDPQSAGFVAHLARTLRQPLSSVINDGGAATLVRQELNRKPSLLASKTLVVWEFVERDIRFGTEGWQDVSLTEGDLLSAN